MSRDRNELHDRYKQLMAQAAAGHLLPSGGLTPRDQRDQLLNQSLVSQSSSRDIHRLTELLEQVVYAREWSEDHEREGLEICQRLFPQFPAIVDRTVVAASKESWRNRWARLFEFLAMLGPYLIAIGLIVVFLLGLTQFVAPTSGGAGRPVGAGATQGQRRGGTHGHYAGERSAIESFNGQWSAATHNGHWNKLRAPTTHEPRNGARATTQLDLNTGDDGYFPDAIDPFRPPLDWTHRQFVYSEIDADYTMASSVTLLRSAIGPATPDSSIHEVEIVVSFQAHRLVPIPSPSANVVVLDYSAKPPTSVVFLLDEQDGLYVRANAAGVRRLRYRIASKEGYSFAPLQTVPFEPDGIPLPANVEADAQRVITAIGQLPQPTFAGTVRRLQAYFATFSVAKIQSHELQDNDFLTVALARKGVCRHRARSFFVVANAAGVRTRLVENQLHSFCEVRQPDGSWRRIEFRLGNEPGPPSIGGDYSWERPWVAASLGGVIYVVTPILACALLALFLLGWHRDVSGHKSTINGSTSSNFLRAKRDAQHDGGHHVTRQLVNHVHDVLRKHNLIAPPTSSDFDMRHLKASPILKARFRSILAFHARNSKDTLEVSDMQRAYWDSYHILQWLKNEARS